MFAQMKTYLIILLLILITTPNFYAQNGDKITGSPEWLVDMYFSKAKFLGKANYFTGAMIEDASEPTIGEELNGIAPISYREIVFKNNKSVYAIEVELDEDIVDFYCYMLDTNEGWKIEAVRRFLLPGFVDNAKDSLSQIKNLSPTDTDLQNLLNLITSNDANLKKYLHNNVNDFYKLLLYIKDEDAKNIQKLMNELNIDAVFEDDAFPGCIFFQIGAFDKTEMGYFFSEERSSLPKISPSRFIYIEEILPKWYIYRII
jgi:hypothetical protein